MVEEIKTVTLTLPSGEQVEQVILREKRTGLFFCLDASYVEQDVGRIHSPYGHGVLQLPEAELLSSQHQT